MIHPLFVVVAECLVVTILVAFLIGKIKTLCVSSIATVSRETDQGEHMQVNANLSIFDSQAKRDEKLQKLFAHGDARREFCHNRLQAILDEARAAKVKAVK